MKENNKKFNKDVTVKFRCTEAENTRIRENAMKVGLTTSEFVRAKVVKDYRMLNKKKDTQIIGNLMKMDSSIEEIERILEKSNASKELSELFQQMKERNQELWQILL